MPCFCVCACFCGSKWLRYAEMLCFCMFFRGWIYTSLGEASHKILRCLYALWEKAKNTSVYRGSAAEADPLFKFNKNTRPATTKVVRRIYRLRLCLRPLFLHIGFHHPWHLGRCRTAILHAYRFPNCFDYCLSGNLVCTADLEAGVINFHCL